MGKPSVVGCGALRHRRQGEADEGRRPGPSKEGDSISIDGSTGEVILEELPTSPSEVLQVVAGTLKAAKSPLYAKFEKLLGWADEVRKLGVRANADIPRDAKVAFAFGARGIGLCRTEHMFFAADRLALVVKMILSAARGQRGLDLTRRLKEQLAEARGAQATEIRKEIARVEKEYGKFIADYTGAIAKLLPMQRADFAGLFREMHGHPVTIRTLDPPLHEFLPKREELMVQIATLQAKGGVGEPARRSRSLSKMLRAVEELHEFNPMLGHRGCRLGITYPEITRMQARAIFEAAVQVARKGTPVKPEVMIPLVGHVEELRRQADDRARGGGGGAGQGAGGEGRLPRGHHDRGPARRGHRGRDREGGRVLLLRHQRPHPDGLRPEPRRRGQVPRAVHRGRDPRQGPLRVHRRRRRRPAGRDRREEGPRRQARPQDRRLRRARRRSRLHPLLPRRRASTTCPARPYRVPIARLAAAQAELEKPVGD